LAPFPQARKVARASKSLISPPFFINQKPRFKGEDLKYDAKIDKKTVRAEKCFVEHEPMQPFVDVIQKVKPLCLSLFRGCALLFGCGQYDVQKRFVSSFLKLLPTPCRKTFQG
jgi:hypothetical protein